MPAHAHLLRQLLLVQKLRASPGRPLPFAELRRHLLEHTSVGDYGGGYTLRTFQRDLPLIAENFGVSVRSRKGQGYYIAEADPLLAGQQALLDAFELQEFLRLPAALAPYVQPEPRRPLGLEHLRPLLRAARQQQVVEVDYQKHWDARPGRRTCGPLLLREFRGRWYVLACMEGSGRLACFGLDRIRALATTGRTCAPPPGFDAATYFADCFGITRPDAGQRPAEIRLRFAPVQGRYTLSFPLHASQTVELETEDEILLRLRVYDTHELRMELLSYGPAVEVLAPAALRAWLQQQHQEAAVLVSH